MQNAFQTLKLKAKHQVHTLLSGESLSKQLAEGYDFSHLRAYQVGDDIRHINWNMTAKLHTPYLNVRYTHRKRNIVVSALMESSLFFGRLPHNGIPDKQQCLIETALLLGYATHYHGDIFTGVAYTQEHHYTTPPTKQPYLIEQFAKQLYETKLLSTKLNKEQAIQNLFSRIQRPSLLFVLSDFLHFTDLSVVAQKHEVIALIIRHKEEIYPPRLGETTLENPENHQRLQTYFSSQHIKAYRDRLQAHDREQITHFRRYGIRYLILSTEDDIVSQLRRLFTP